MVHNVRASLASLRNPRWPFDNAVHDYEHVYVKLTARLKQLVGNTNLRDVRILDLGCGYAYPVVALFHSAGCRVCGADVESVFFRDGRLATFRQRLRERGPLRAIYHAGPRYSGYRRYYVALAALAGESIRHGELGLYSYDGRRLPFADETFDIVCSNAVLEHVEDLAPFTREAARVLRRGGVVDMVWHNFFCPSGGHRDAKDVAQSPWGHVTGDAAPSCFLNRKRPDDMREAFEDHFSVLRVVRVGQDHSLEGEASYAPEGMDQLEHGWRQRLSDFPDALLTTRSFLIQAVKE